MISALELSPGQTAESVMAPFIIGGKGNSRHEAAAMLWGAVEGAEDYQPGTSDILGDEKHKYWRVFTGVDHCGPVATTGIRTLMSFSELGHSIGVLGEIDLEAFASEGIGALPEQRRLEWAAADRAMSPGRAEAHLLGEQAITGLMVQKFNETERDGRGGYEPRAAKPEDIVDLHSRGWVVQLEVNGHELADQAGYVTHPLIVTSADGNGVTVHNPGGGGLLSAARQEISYDRLHGPWAAAGFVLHTVGRIVNENDSATPFVTA
jgi:hypothetical protein